MAKLFPRPDYGVDAPAVMRNLFLFGFLCLLLGLALPHTLHLFGIIALSSQSFFWPAGFLIGEGCLFLLYVKVGKFRHRDMMLGLHSWRGDEQVLDVGCGRGLLLAGAAKKVPDGHATGIDVWSNVDMGGNSASATTQNLQLEGLLGNTTLISVPAQEMTFADGTFDVIVSNLCIHNIYDRPTRIAALHQIVRVLKPGGVALISDYKRTAEYADVFSKAGMVVEKKRGSFLTTFPPLTVVVARKPL
ncbi:Methyltransferase domain-containing protein [Granulicella pectinivorans]|jgi:SAM-dependent methyltransferase|uniref:Methyltransferase domain-containing protein n=1 Tax=Granulicella pectinivorans TaxID=474950 RepID=A0A1I6N158_9BACT|nr:class I SAM-dependent methyltransferase [Granulicella pectinivorans]SFS21644.1 Methyltransferase domain-containing protein [Granulicella pectinivorans]